MSPFEVWFIGLFSLAYIGIVYYVFVYPGYWRHPRKQIAHRRQKKKEKEMEEEEQHNYLWELHRRLNDVERENRELKRCNDDLTSENESLSLARYDLRKALNFYVGIQTTLENVESDLDNAMKDINDLREENVSLQEKLERARSMLRHPSRSLETIKHLQSELDEEREKNRQLEELISTPKSDSTLDDFDIDYNQYKILAEEEGGLFKERTYKPKIIMNKTRVLLQIQRDYDGEFNSKNAKLVFLRQNVETGETWSSTVVPLKKKDAKAFYEWVVSTETEVPYQIEILINPTN